MQVRQLTKVQVVSFIIRRRRGFDWLLIKLCDAACRRLDSIYFVPLPLIGRLIDVGWLVGS